MIHAPPITHAPDPQRTPSVSEGANQTAPLTPSRAELLLTTLAAHDYDTAAVVATGLFTTIEIADLFQDQTFQTRLAALMTLRRTKLTMRAAKAREVCMDALEDVIETTDNLVEKRRAATSLLRATTAPLIPTRESRPRDPGSKEKPSEEALPDPPSPTDVPDPEHTPETVANIIAHAARTVDNPEPNAGLATIAAFAAENATIEDQPFAPEDPEDPDDVHEAIETLATSTLAQARTSTTHWCSNAPTKVSPDHCRHFRGFYVKKTDTRHEIAITLTRSHAPDSRSPGCWLVAALTVRRILPSY